MKSPTLFLVVGLLVFCGVSCRGGEIVDKFGFGDTEKFSLFRNVEKCEALVLKATGGSKVVTVGKAAYHRTDKMEYLVESMSIELINPKFEALYHQTYVFVKALGDDLSKVAVYYLEGYSIGEVFMLGDKDFKKCLMPIDPEKAKAWAAEREKEKAKEQPQR